MALFFQDRVTRFQKELDNNSGCINSTYFLHVYISSKKEQKEQQKVFCSHISQPTISISQVSQSTFSCTERSTHCGTFL